MVGRMAGPHIAWLIDEFLEAPKELGGIPKWRDMGAHDQHRLVIPLFLEGDSTGLDLEICTYPNTEPLRFGITLRMERCVWRLDYSHTDVHPNSLSAPPDIAGAILVGPHYHAWEDNRHFATHNALPKRLLNGRVFSENIKTLEEALDWFCRKTNIIPPPPGLITLPARNRLF